MMKMTIWLCLVVTMATCIRGYDDDYFDTLGNGDDDQGYDEGSQTNNDDTYHELINMELSINSLSKFMGFKCPKGYRCLPVLECLPCDYGSYKPKKGAGLCEICPPGCTTLRKGAENWKECIPKCPPGYEESECGKTCTKCRPGHYKSNWKNEKCRTCPTHAQFDRSMVGMRRRSQCYAFDVTTEEMETVTYTTEKPVTRGCEGLGACTEDVYQHVEYNHVSAPRSNCKQFCQCTYDDQLISYYWSLHNCSTGTLFDDALNTCAHENDVTCTSLSIPTSTLPTEKPISTDVTGHPGTKGCEALGACTEDVYLDVDYNHVSAPGSNCKQFCQCSYDAELVSYYWSLHNCSTGTLFDDALNTCAHENDVTCTGLSIPTSTLPTEKPISTDVTGHPGTKGCEALGACTEDVYLDVDYQHVSAPGSSCKQFCQCTYDFELISYYWSLHNCSTGTLFDDALNTCAHDDEVTCTSQSIPTSTLPTEKPISTEGQSTPTSTLTTEKPISTDGQSKPTSTLPTEKPISTDGQSKPTSTLPTEKPISTDGTGHPDADEVCGPLGTCDANRYSNPDENHVAAPGSNCEEYCQCAHRTEAPSYYWVLHDCAIGTLFDNGMNVCNHKDAVTCTDTAATTTMSPTTDFGEYMYG